MPTTMPEQEAGPSRPKRARCRVVPETAATGTADDTVRDTGALRGLIPRFRKLEEKFLGEVKLEESVMDSLSNIESIMLGAPQHEQLLPARIANLEQLCGFA